MYHISKRTTNCEAPDYGILSILLLLVFLRKEDEMLKEPEVIACSNNTFVFALLLLVLWLASSFLQDRCGGTMRLPYIQCSVSPFQLLRYLVVLHSLHKGYACMTGNCLNRTCNRSSLNKRAAIKTSL